MPMPQDTQDQENEYLAAFNEDTAPAAEKSEDEAFGLNLPEDGTSDPAEGESTVVMNGEPAAEEEAAPAEAAVDAAAEADPAAEEPAAEEDGPTDPKEIQRQKSWEGRLRARERELEAREAALAGKAAAPAAPEAPADDGEAGGDAQAADAMESAADQLEADGDAAGAQAVGEVAEKVESGEMSAEQALATLAEDFGDDFVKNVRALVQSMVKEVAGAEISKLDGTVKQVIAELSDDRARSHFETIADRHEDFNQIGDDRILAYIESLPEEQRSAAEQAVGNGSARQVIKFLDNLKAWEASQGAAAEEPAPTPSGGQASASSNAMDAAEGVRSGGLRLPETPERADDYDTAWNQF